MSTTPRLFVEADLAEDAEVALERGQQHYLLHVLRLADGAEVVAFNGRDGEWRTRVARSGKRVALVAVAQVRAQPAPPALALMFAPLKQARQDYSVQKAVELGVGRLLPVLCDHGQVRKVNADRLRANAIEAAEQCEILSLPEIAPFSPLGEVLSAWAGDGGHVIFCDEGSHDTDPLTILAGVAPGPLAVLVGPEGGFSETERKLLRGVAHATPLPLGPRVMRADTAAVAALAVVQAALGDWRHEAPRWAARG